MTLCNADAADSADRCIGDSPKAPCVLKNNFQRFVENSVAKDKNRYFSKLYESN